MEENTGNNSGIFFPFFLKSHSSEGPMYISRENSFYDTKISSKEFQLQYNKSFTTSNQCIDNKLTVMLNKTNYANTLKKIEAILSQPDMQTVPDTVGYKKVSELLFELSSFVNNPPLDKEDQLRVLQLQNVLIDKMIQFVKTKVVIE